MRELIEIVDAFHGLSAQGQHAAIATVVAVEGSSYRRPGARMLISHDGQTWGGVSGGCLERDVARNGRIVIASGRTLLRHYDTTDDEDLSSTETRPTGDPGASLGCGGAIEILIEPASTAQPGPLAPIMQAIRGEQSRAMASIYRVGGAVTAAPGQRLVVESDGSLRTTDISDANVAEALAEELRDTTPLQRGGRSRRRLFANGWIDLLLEQLTPPQPLVVFGDGSDVAALVEMAGTLGWAVTIVATKPRLASAMPRVSRVIYAPATDPVPPELVRGVAPIVLMTHDQRRDVKILGALADSSSPYIGLLGPLHRTRRILEAASLGDDPALGRRLFSPIGLDIGADTPQKIALAIVAEIQAVLSARSGGFLRDRRRPIHDFRSMLQSDPSHPVLS